MFEILFNHTISCILPFPWFQEAFGSTKDAITMIKYYKNVTVTVVTSQTKMKKFVENPVKTVKTVILAHVVLLYYNLIDSLQTLGRLIISMWHPFLLITKMWHHTVVTVPGSKQYWAILSLQWNSEGVITVSNFFNLSLAPVKLISAFFFSPTAYRVCS